MYNSVSWHYVIRYKIRYFSWIKNKRNKLSAQYIFRQTYIIHFLFVQLYIYLSKSISLNQSINLWQTERKFNRYGFLLSLLSCMKYNLKNIWNVWKFIPMRNREALYRWVKVKCSSVSGIDSRFRLFSVSLFSRIYMYTETKINSYKLSRNNGFLLGIHWVITTHDASQNATRSLASSHVYPKTQQLKKEYRHVPSEAYTEFSLFDIEQFVNNLRR